MSKTTMDINVASMPSLIKESIAGRKSRNPKQEIPIEPFDEDILNKDRTPKFIWFGHSAILLQLEGKNLLIDPMFGPDASPVGPIRTKRFSNNTLDILKKLPKIDAVVLTHDHYDHLDFQSIRLLKDLVNCFLVPLGVGRHLEMWDIDKIQITEFDWWQEGNFFDLDFVFTPARHFSGRGILDRTKSLWGGWVIRSSKHNIYWSGDGGYDEHFKLIGERFGPFDWGFMECGQYNQRWHQIHMYPEEAVKAAEDAKVHQAIPVHWGGFSLALHHWKEPILRFDAEAKKRKQHYLAPKPGLLIDIYVETTEKWWDQYE